MTFRDISINGYYRQFYNLDKLNISLITLQNCKNNLRIVLIYWENFNITFLYRVFLNKCEKF